MDGIERKLLGVCGFGKVVVNAVADVDVKIFSAKGGITFSGIGTKALKVRRALVMGQIHSGMADRGGKQVSGHFLCDLSG